MIARFNAPWLIVFSDSAFQIALDTSRVTRVEANSYLLWMQTRWLVPRSGAIKRTPSPFNRELIHTFLRCEPVAFKVARTVVSLDDGPTIDSTGAGVVAARRSAWHSSNPGSADAAAGIGTCRILARRSKQASSSIGTESRRQRPNER
jgi:hypothetical protein